MSSHESIAAQFWLWPDPVMKRDAQGRILFINAAFLQLYGGTVEAWTGNVLQGWPAPQPTEPGAYPVPYRFETRMPSQDPNQAEDVYDWIEQSASDGTAFALARNVTPFVSAAQSPAQPAQGQEAQSYETQAQSSHAQNGSFEQPDANQAPQQPSYEEPAQPSYQMQSQEPDSPTPPPEQPASSSETQDYTPLASTPPAQNETPQSESSSYQDHPPAADAASALPTPQQQASQDQQDFQAIAEMASEEAAPDNQGQAEARPPEGQATPPQNASGEAEKRDFERRALPLDENSAVLGNNWRDAVIAKALGVEDSSPQKTAAPAPQDEPDSVSPQSGGTKSSGPEKRILLAEDNAINALLTRTLLEAEGHIVETVEDGVLAVEAMKNQDYDLIFMDMRMPNMDGLEATRKIRALPHVTKELPIIALTANAFDDDRNACFDSGMNDFMTKPVSAEELTQMVRTWTNEQAKKDAA